MEDASGRLVAEVSQTDVRHDPDTGAFRISGTPTGGAAASPSSAVTVVLEGAGGAAVATLTNASVTHDPDTGAFCVSGESQREAGAAAIAVPSLLTVVVTTSPARCNPSLEMLETVVDSFKLVPGLEACRLIVVCDGCNVGKKHRPLARAARCAARCRAGFTSTHPTTR